MKSKNPVVFGIAGKTLTQEEKDFFKATNPCGYILFARNIESAEQLKSLTDSIREVSNDPHIPILIDQEGGRVARIKPPLMKEYPPLNTFGLIANSSLDEAERQTYANYKNLGTDLKQFGINFNCAPVADLYFENADKIIGSRSFGSDPEVVAKLCKKAMEGLRDAGVTPIFKHAPGHGRANCDSHLDLPTVDTPLDELHKTDFKVFKDLQNEDAWVMTAHIKFTNIDPDNCITLSKKGIDFLRNELGLTNQTIVSDDLSMKALKGDLGQLAQQALVAGCDVVLHCNGNLHEMQQIASGMEII